MIRQSQQKEKTATVLSRLNGALHVLLSNDPRVVVIGEDIADPYGGAFKVTRGLSHCYPERVFSTPISEGAIIGIAAGLALRGFKPVAEIMFGDFLTLAADQLINHAAKFRWMYNDAARAAMVVRTPMGGRRGYGPTHSQSLEKHFLGVPGLMVVAINPVTDPGELLSMAVAQGERPVLFIENKQLYAQELVTDVPGWTMETVSDAAEAFPTVVLRQQFADAADAMLFSYGGMTSLCIEAVNRLHDEEGLNCDVAVFSQLSPMPQTHLGMLLKQGLPSVCACVEEAWAESGWGSEMIASIEAARAESEVEHPAIRHVRIGARSVPIGASRELESKTLPQTDDIVQGLVNCF